MGSPQVVLEGLGFPESTRWRDGRIWLCNWGAGEVLAVTPSGDREVRARLQPSTIPFSIDWLPDGRLLVIDGPRRLLLSQGEDGSCTRTPISPASGRPRSTSWWSMSTAMPM